MLKLWNDRQFRTYFYVLFAIYTCLGLFANAWISDEFDYLRLSITSYLTVPALCLFLCGFIEDRCYWRKWPWLFANTLAIVFVTLIWGHIILLNALGSNKKELMSQATFHMTINTEAKRGAFGMIYQTRW